MIDVTVPQTMSEEMLIFVGLKTLLEVQERGEEAFPKDHLPDEDRFTTEDMRTAILSIFVELGELTNTLSWKPWKRSHVVDRDRVVDEMADVLHFIAWFMRSLEARYRITPDEVALGFMRKHELNMKRFSGQVPGREPPASLDTTADDDAGRGDQY